MRCGCTACRWGPQRKAWCAVWVSSIRSGRSPTSRSGPTGLPLPDIPRAKPPRPEGRERNVVVTLWDWGDEKTYLHDEIATDKRNPTVNAYGKIYSAPEDSTDDLPILDPKTHSVAYMKSTPRDPNTPNTSFIERAGFPSLPSPYWGAERIWKSQTSVHNPMLDGEGRVWMTSRIRPSDNPDFCKEGSEHPSAKLFPMKEAGRHVAVHDPKTGKLTHVDTCFTTHHLIFAEDADNTLWLSGGGARQQVVGWINTKKFLETGDAAASQNWSPMILDSNGNGKRDEGYVEPDQPVDPTKDKRIIAGLYGIGYNPNDGSIWGSVLSMPGGVIRIIPGDNPPATTLAGILRSAIQRAQGGSQRFRSARRGHRPQRRGLDSPRQWPPCKLRSQEMPRPAERTESHRPTLSGRVDTVPVPGTPV